MRARAGKRQKKVEYAHTEFDLDWGRLIFCHSCGCTGEPDVLTSNILGSGGMKRCHACRSLHFTFVEPENLEVSTSELKYVQEKNALIRRNYHVEHG